MNLVFDTSAFSQLDLDRRLLREASRDVYGRRLLPFAADAELRFGYKVGDREEVNLKTQQQLMDVLSIELILPDATTNDMYADLAAWARKNGISTSNNDLWIAAVAVQYGAQLLTTDLDFTALPQVRLVHL